MNVEKRGLICPVCETLAEPGDAFCAAGDYDFTPSDPTVGIDAQGHIVEVDGLEIAPASKLADALTAAGRAGKVVAPPVVAAPAPAPVVAAPPAVAPVADAVVVASGKKRSIVVDVDAATARDGRPAEGEDGYQEPPKVYATHVELTKKIHPFGRLKLGDDFVLLDGDEVVSKLHGYFRTEGDRCIVENQSGSGIFVRNIGYNIGAKGDRYELKNGDVLEVGDWYTITYREED